MPYPPAVTFQDTTPATALDPQQNQSSNPVSVGNAHTAMGTANDPANAGQPMAPYDFDPFGVQATEDKSWKASDAAVPDGTDFTLSGWFRDPGTAANNVPILDCGQGQGSGVETRTVYVDAKTTNFGGLQLFAAGSVALTDQAYSVTLFDNGWHHFAVSARADGATPLAYYVDDVRLDNGSTTVDAGTIQYLQANWFSVGVSGFSSATGKADDIEMMDVWFDDTFNDMSVEANRRKFISASGNPVNLGTGQVFGSQPQLFLDTSNADDELWTSRGIMTLLEWGTAGTITRVTPNFP